MYKVSVIMPIYNNEDTLRPAIESILNQSVFDFELILINDGSTDSSTQICMEYAKREPLLIEVIHQERLGFAKTRNRGLSQAQGSYIYFADARNVFAPRMLEKNIKLAEEQNAELVVFGFSQPKENIKHIPNLPFLLSKERFRNHFRNFHYFFPYELCNKLFEVDYLRTKGIKFNDFPLKEESFFNLDVYRNINKVVFNRESFFEKSCLNNYEFSKYQKEFFNIQIDLINHLEDMLIYWGASEKYQDLLIKEYYHLLEAEVLNLTSSNLNLSNKDLEKEITRILSDDRIIGFLNKENVITTKNIYERVLWNSFRNRNTRVIIELVRRKNQTNKVTGNIKGKLRKWLS